jgi:hypothetical protein
VAHRQAILNNQLPAPHRPPSMNFRDATDALFNLRQNFRYRKQQVHAVLQ